MFRKIILALTLAALLCATGQPFGLNGAAAAGNEDNSDYFLSPPFLAAAAPPLVMLVMGRSHKLYYEAYNDASDLDGDGDLDVGYKPDEIEYYGYFDSYKCYEYNGGGKRFDPTSFSVSNVAGTNNKACSGADEWSGDLLNYLTMSRMDAMRKVLYGGYRAVDTTSDVAGTVLQRTFIPQDAHSWGKEYKDVATHGYDITEYSPLSLPAAGSRHLFASTTLSDNGEPILRVLPDNMNRIWQWVSKERPIADTSLESTGATLDHHPDSHKDFDDLVEIYGTDAYKQCEDKNLDKIDDSGNKCGYTNEHYLTIYTGDITVDSAGQYEFAVDGSDAVELLIDDKVVVGWYGEHDDCGGCSTHSGKIYLSKGKHKIEFRHERGDQYDDKYKLYWYHPEDSSWKIVQDAWGGNVFKSKLTRTQYTIDAVTIPASQITDYIVRVQVCDTSVGLENNCKTYLGNDGKLGTNDDVYKPVGLLQRYGETEQMLFGLISGSYAKNTSGGVLRKKISLIADEINTTTGQYKTGDGGVTDPDDDSYKNNGIIKTIDKFRINNYDYSDLAYVPGWPDAWVTTRPMTEGEFPDWGNPTGEMMYEALRYFSGASAGKSDFLYSSGDDTDDKSLGLPLATWDDPYSPDDRWCSQPFMLVISDINPSYDADQLPGSAFSGWAAESLGDSGGSLDVETLLDTISSSEGISGNYYIGGVGTGGAANYDSSCSPKALSSLGNVHGICPEEPTKLGSYYSAAVAYYGLKEDINAAANDQKVLTFAVGLSSPLPKIEIPIGDPTQYITLVPFAKSVGGCLDILPTNEFTPTNTIVDFYVDTITETYGKLRINYEDVEQAADHDMDAIVLYEYWVEKFDTVSSEWVPVANSADGERVRIKLTSEYASGCIIQHAGYIISGTSADGTYLEVVDSDFDGKKDGSHSDVDYFLDTPPGQPPGGTYADSQHLPPWAESSKDETLGYGWVPFSAERTFTPGATATATLLENPLWYAAKWGSFRDHDFDGTPNQVKEWDNNGDGTPDNYFYVQNPLFLEKQLNQAFIAILERASSGTSASVLSASRSGEGAVYQSIFYPQFKHNVTWVGDVHALMVDSYGNIREDTDANNALDDKPADPNDQDLIVEFSSVTAGEVKLWKDLDLDGVLENCTGCDDDQTPVTTSIQDLKYLWSASNWLNGLSDSEVLNEVRTIDYDAFSKSRYIFTFIDANNNMVADGRKISDNGEVISFASSPAANLTAIKPYLHLAEPFTQSTAAQASTLATNQIQFIRGKDQSGMRNRTDDSGNTYRLGDIVHSTPTLVSTPAEHYDLLYTDSSYLAFWRKYRGRRAVIYVGANDGMFRAFNGGFFDTSQKKFWKAYNPATGLYSDGGATAADLGLELWAYVPFNLLPHLYWLTDPNYQHVFYVDMKPKVFDAKIFANDATHPNGWGTVLVGGMRFGGGRIRTDKDHDGEYEPNDATLPDQIMKSAYFVLDITDPESEPEVLAEISFDDLGFTTSYPGAIVVKSKSSDSPNNWYLVLGSGPNGARLEYAGATGSFAAGQTLKGKNSGTIATIVSNDTADDIFTLSEVIGWFEEGEQIWVDLDDDGNIDSSEPKAVANLANSTSDLKHGLSSQKARVYVVDLNALADGGTLKTYDYNGTAQTGASAAVSFLDTRDSNADYDFGDNSYIGDFITVDLNLDYATDAMYFGTVSDTATGLAGKLKRLVLSDPETNIVPTDTTKWDQYSTLFDAGQPVSASPTIAMDWKKRTWVFFGTGRFVAYNDITDTSQQSFYGIKEPWADANSNSMVDMNTTVNEMTWAAVSATDLMNESDVVVYANDKIKYSDGSPVKDLASPAQNLDTFSALNYYMEEDPIPRGWQLNFSAARERNLGQAALLGDVLTFTTYAPDPSACQNEGYSYLYAVNYKTGTAFSTSVIGLGNDVDVGGETTQEVLRAQSLGRGLAVSPALHTGREKGSKAFVQTSTGAILVIEQQNPGAVKSGKAYWQEE
jgi:type IV pilus assembly protein PilY1